MRGLGDTEATDVVEDRSLDDPDFEYDTLGQGIPREVAFRVGGRRRRFDAVGGPTHPLSTRVFHGLLVLMALAVAIYVLLTGFVQPFFLSGAGRPLAEWVARAAGA